MASSMPAENLLPPSNDELMRQMYASLPGVWVYNPSQDWILQEAASVPFYIPPDLAGKMVPHPQTKQMVKGDGMLEVKSKMNPRTGAPIVEMQFAIQVLIATRGDVGVTFIPDGSPELQEKYKEKARAIYKEFRAKQIDNIISAHDQKIARHQAQPSNIGKPLPVPGPTVIRAMKERDKMLRANSAMLEFQCNHCSYPGDDAKDLAEHIKTAHPMLAPKVQPITK